MIQLQVVEFANLDSCKSPAEKMNCLCSTYDYIFAELKAALINNISKYAGKLFFFYKSRLLFCFILNFSVINRFAIQSTNIFSKLVWKLITVRTVREQ